MMQEQIWKYIAEMDTTGFFITAEMQRTGTMMPEGLETFIRKKLKVIREGGASRRFVFQEGEWRKWFWKRLAFPHIHRTRRRDSMRFI